MSIMFYLLVISFLILFPMDASRAASNALIVWGTAVVPVLFPYMLFSRHLFTHMRRLPLPSGILAAVLGMLGGSPSGASIAVSCSSQLSRRALHALCALTGTVSPMFILGTIQTWTHNPILCRKLLLCHWAGAAVCAYIAYMACPVSEQTTQPASAPIHAAEPLAQSIDAILQVGGCIICCSVLAEMIRKFPFPAQFPHAFAHAILEISGGIHAICESNISDAHKSLLFSAAIGFSGFSILSQNLSFFKHTGIRMKDLLFFALLRAAASAGLMALLQ